MFVYLSKKIAIPHNIKLHAVSWNSEQGWIACGGANGLLKVLKLEGKKSKKKKEAAAAATAASQSNLSMNQTLEGHNGNVVVVTWNENYRKLTSSDQYGLIIVWMLHKGMWFEEMINNRNKSVVRDMKWTSDGQKICIIYEDGAVIVGSVDGNRLWGKELEMELTHVEWSPDGRNILFGTMTGEVHLYDNLGNFISKLNIYTSLPGTTSTTTSSSSNNTLAGLQWYNGSTGYYDQNVPTLAICYESGRIQIMRDDADENPVLIDTGLSQPKMRWNTNGTVVAIAGVKQGGEATQMVQFYSPHGKHLRSLRVPGSGISSLSWEGGSLRLALAVDSFIYFANIRPDYDWGYFSNTLVYAFTKPDRLENCVCFWDTTTDERYIKYVKQLVAIRACDEHCVFATRTDDESGQFILILCNAIGSPVDSKYIDIEPLYLTMTPYHVIVASNDLCYIWQYRTPVTKLTSLSSSSSTAKNASNLAAAAAAKRKEGRERVFHIDENPSSSSNSTSSSASGGNTGGIDYRSVNRSPTNDPICAITASKSTLVIARASGMLMRLSLPHLQVENKYVVRCRPQLMALNCDSSRLSIIDINGVLTLFDLDARAGPAASPSAAKSPTSSSSSSSQQLQQQVGVHLEFERRDIWDMIWSDDNPELLACMEKTRMYIFRGLHPEEPVMSSGYLCSFSDLCIKAVLLDDIIVDPEHPDKECVVNFETKSLRDTRELLNTVPIQEAQTFIEANPHPRLWRILAETALEQLNFTVADKAFVRCQDYQGIQFVKRLKMLSDRSRQRAEVCAYFRRFDEAETIYLQQDQKDLAVELRLRLGDWFRVVQLIQSGGGDDALLMQAYNEIGDYYADRQKFAKAYKFYAKSKNFPALVNCAYILDDFATLTQLVEQIPTGTSFLKDVGDKFQSVGLCNEAVSAYLRADDAKAAIDCCVLLNSWDQAVQLAEKYSFTQIEGLLTKYAQYLLQKNKLFQAVELYRKAGRHGESAKLLKKIAEHAAVNGTKYPLRVKKLYVMAALEIDKYKSKMFEMASNAVLPSKPSPSPGAPSSSSSSSSSVTSKASAMQTLATLFDTDVGSSSSSSSSSSSVNSRDLDDAWHGAEAYHYYVLAHRQVYKKNLDAAMKTALRLKEYEDVLDTRALYSLIALTTYYNKYYHQCSRSFIKLESAEINVVELPNSKEASAESKQKYEAAKEEAIKKGAEEKERFKQLAFALFLQNPPRDPDNVRLLPCPNNTKCTDKVHEWSAKCEGCGKKLPGCIVTGRTIFGSGPDIWTCKICKHKAFDREMATLQNCPLCHSPCRA